MITEKSLVVRLAPPSDYTRGRVGQVLEINNVTKRARVLWLYEPDGRNLQPQIRTWVRLDKLEEYKKPPHIHDAV